MSDVVTKARTGSVIHNGSVVIYVNKLQPLSQVIYTSTAAAPVPSAILARYDTRFDDRSYYSA